MRARHATGGHVANLVCFFCFLQMFGAGEGLVVQGAWLYPILLRVWICRVF